MVNRGSFATRSTGVTRLAAIRALTLKEPTRSVEPAYVDPRWSTAPAPRFAPLPQLVPTTPAYVQEALF